MIKLHGIEDMPPPKAPARHGINFGGAYTPNLAAIVDTVIRNRGAAGFLPGAARRVVDAATEYRAIHAITTGGEMIDALEALLNTEEMEAAL